MSVCKPVIVLGAERSGTSMCAEMVHAWGAYAGDLADLPEPDDLNPRGRWEYLPLWDLLAEIGGFAAGASWWDEGFGARVTAKSAELTAATPTKRRVFWVSQKRCGRGASGSGG